MYNTESQTLVARKRHRCTNCGEAIEPGAQYERWVTFDGSAFTSKMHPECLKSLQEDADGYALDYMPYIGERPRLEQPQ